MYLYAINSSPEIAQDSVSNVSLIIRPDLTLQANDVNPTANKHRLPCAPPLYPLCHRRTLILDIPHFAWVIRSCFFTFMFLLGRRFLFYLSPRTPLSALMTCALYCLCCCFVSGVGVRDASTSLQFSHYRFAADATELYGSRFS